MSSQPLLEVGESRQGLSSLYELIAAELASAEAIFQKELASRFPFVQSLVDHSADFQGKRLRPALVLFSGRACGSLSEDHAVLAAVVEMIHTATLVHDDVLDEAVIRRHAATVNAEWGNETAVLLGDYLFTHAFHLAASLESTRACRWIGAATNRVCEGEMQQVFHRGNLGLHERDYFEIIEAKTAELTAVSCRLGAFYAGASESTVAALDSYGRNLGIAFQIADDVLDIWGEERATGKSLGTDLKQQKLTLPVIKLLALAGEESVPKIRSLVAGAKPEARRRLKPLLEESGALNHAWQVAKRHVRLAIDSLDCLADSEATTALRTLAQYVIRRPS